VTVNDVAIAVLFVGGIFLTWSMQHVLKCLPFLHDEAIRQNRRIDVIEQSLMSSPEIGVRWVELKDQMDNIPIGGEGVEVKGEE